MNVEIKKLNPSDIDLFIQIIRVFEQVFEMKNFVLPAKSYLEKLLQKDDFLVFAALKNSEVIGGLTGYVLHQYYSTLPLVYIYDLAVASKYQRQGIGKKLIAGVNGYGKENNCEEVFVQADLEDTYALDFYRATGGLPESVVHFTYPLNRPSSIENSTNPE